MTNEVRVFQNVSGYGRHVNHDPRSKQFAFRGEALASVKHKRYIPVLDQGQLGSCTGNAGTGALGTGVFANLLPPGLLSTSDPALDEQFAVQLYSDASAIDDYTAGNYPPTDTGSDGLSIAKVLQRRGLISGYQHCFTLNDALAALSSRPVIIGVNWYNSMMNTDANGLLNITPTAKVDGGHEVVLDEINLAAEVVGGTNSWSESWGVNGRFYLTFDTFQRLLNEQGDCTVFTPITQPAPTPAPVQPGASVAFTADQRAALDSWSASPHIWRKATKAADAWKTATRA